MARKEASSIAAPGVAIPGRRGAEAPFALAFAAMALGVAGMGASPVFVRWAEVGPFASAFWRMALAVPFLYGWLLWERRRRTGSGGAASPRADAPIIAAVGVLFAGDLFFWHLAILNTSVANATLLATMAPIFVALGARLVLGEAVTPRIVAGVVLGVAGAAVIVGRSARFEPDNLDGDIYGLITACFFGAYFLAVSRARRRLTSATVMFYPALIASGLLLLAALALDDGLMPATMGGAAALLSLALVSQVGGQGMAAFALGHLPAVFSSLVIFLEAIVAAALAALLLAEAISPWQIVGGALILAGLYTARPRRKTPTP